MPDGDLVLEVRYHVPRSEDAWQLELRTPDGAPVPTFGQEGRVTLEGGGGGLAVTGDGDIVVATEKCDGKLGSVEMLDPGGAKVTTFGQEGCGPDLGFQASRIALDSQGRFVLAASVYYCEPCSKDSVPRRQTLIARVLPDGTSDPGFGTKGSVGTHAILPESEGSFGGEGPLGLGTTADGGVLLGGTGALLRLNPDGSLDTAYGQGGVATASSVSLVVEPDGSAVFATNSDKGVAVTRLGPTGAPDPSFGDGGTLPLSLPPDSTSELIASAPGGGYLIAGKYDDCDPCAPPPFLERLTAGGALDPSYGNGGVAANPLIPPPASPSEQHALAVAPDGSAIVVGGNLEEDGFAAAWTPSGTPDASFGAGGFLTEHRENPALLEPTGLALSPGGGLTLLNEHSDFPGLDPGLRADFGADGRQLPGPDGASVVETPVHGTIAPVGNDGGVAVLRATGKLPALDTDGGLLEGFGKRGRAPLPKGFAARAMAPAPGGGLALFGTFEQRAMAVYRLGAGGHPLRHFGNGGLTVVRFPHRFSVGTAGLVEGDGDIVVTGWAGGRVGIARLLPDGRLDRSYGHGGRVRGPLEQSSYGPRVAPLDGGVVIATLRGKWIPDATAGLIRLDHDGHLLRGFGHRGIVQAVPERGLIALLTGADRIVLVSDPYLEKGHHGGGVELRSYLPDGSVDRSFGVGGVSFHGVGRGEAHSFAPAAAVQQRSGKVVVAGLSRDGERVQAELVRFLLR